MTGLNSYKEISDRTRMTAVPLISVQMLAYQHEPFIGRAIQGVIDQHTDFPIELIIAEDCSTDDTLRIALEYQQRYPELIRVLTSDQNVGMHANADRCLTAARGDYIAICEGDDYWCDQDKLSRQVEVFRSYPQCSLVFHAAAYIDGQSGRRERTSKQSLFSRILDTSEIVLGDGGLLPTASILVRREVALDLPDWYHQAPVGDYPLALRAALRGKIAYLDRVMSVYRINVPQSWTKRYVPEIGPRMHYAQQIEEMFSGFSAESGHRYDRATREMISKYYSDPLVRISGALKEKRRFYNHVARKLMWSDRLLVWLAVTFGLRLPLLKDVLRKLRTLTRLIKAHILSERIRIRNGK